MSNKGLLIIVILLLLAVFTMVFMRSNEESPGEQIANDFGEMTEEIGDEIDDATTNPN